MSGGARSLPRLLTIMGSGETAPTMVKVHRLVVERLGPEHAHGLLLDTPFGFQTNADDIAARAVAYFRDSVGATLEVAGLRSAAALGGRGGDAIISRLAAAPLVFSGPGSPTYALRQWKGTLVPAVLAEKLALGGAVTFASAAAIALGAVSVPVYEVYKVGDEPHWLEGLDLLGPLGLDVALIPHYDNAEGGTHDTRYAYLGEERLARLEAELPEGAFVLGVDEHTGLVLDLDARTAEVLGRGAVTVRAKGNSARIEAGRSVPLTSLADLAAELAAELAAGGPSAGRRRTLATAEPGVRPTDGGSETAVDSGSETTKPLLEAIRDHELAFASARDRGDAAGMVEAVVALEDELWAWRADTLQSDEFDRGQASLRAMVGELGSLARTALRDPAEVVGPYVELALALRDSARSEGRFTDADDVRDRLKALGVEVRDAPQGSTWELSPHEAERD